MKAWFVWYGDDWGDYVHAETATKAKSRFYEEWSPEFDAEGWIYLRPFRYPRLDDVPITNESILEGYDEHEREEYKFWVPICDCEICQGKEIKQ